MEIKKDILGNTPKVGDIIAFNPTVYKGLMSGTVAGFTKSGSPEVKPERVYSDGDSEYGKVNKNGMYTPKTGFVIGKSSEESTDTEQAPEDSQTRLEIGATYSIDKYGSTGILRGFDEDDDPYFEILVNKRGYCSDMGGYSPFLKSSILQCDKIS